MSSHTFPHQLDQIIRLVGEHFTSDPGGVSLLPTLATYSLYQCLVKETARLKNKQLSLGFITFESPQDSIEGLVVIEDNGKPFEVIVVRNRRSITAEVINSTFRRFGNAQTGRFCFLTTAKPYVRLSEQQKIRELLHRVETEQSCEVIIDGVLHTIKCYLRILHDPSSFWQKYSDNQKLVSLAKTDPGRKHLKRWQSLLKKMATRN
jgi:DNA (cytosine-5)-methyltransferase 1